MSNEYLSVQEAVTYTGKSLSTIRRLYKKYLDTDDIRINNVNGRKSYLISKRLLNDVYDIENKRGYQTTIDEQIKVVKGQEFKDDDKTKKELYDELFKELHILRKQLEVKDKQIESLNNRLAETNKILMVSQMTKQNELLEAKPVAKTEPVKESKKESNTTKTKKKASKKVGKSKSVQTSDKRIRTQTRRQSNNSKKRTSWINRIFG